MILTFFKASGHSMSPEIKDNSFFIASIVPFIFYEPKKGDIILFKKENKNIVKRIVKIDRDLIYIEGDNKLDSKKFAPIKRKEIRGKVIWIF